MFGSDDDIDFIPGNSSKLESLFSGAKSDGDNASFTFIAPKQPKKGIPKDDRKSKSEVTITQGNAPAESAADKMSIIIVTPVYVYQLVDGKYAPQGKLGAAVLGNTSRNIYQLLLYKGKHQHVTSTKITPTFSFNVQPNNHGSFYNDQGQNWSINFDDSKDCENFAREVALARAASQGVTNQIVNLLTQDLSVPNQRDGDNITANEGDILEVFYSVHTYTTGKLGKLVESNYDSKKPQKVKIRKDVWEEGLIGISRGVKRILMLPPQNVGPWTKSVAEGTSLAVEVIAGRMKQVKLSQPNTPPRPTSPRLPSVADSGESAFESSADDSIRARGASISQALSSSPRTNKANLMSRMARLGQATLPLRGAISCNPSDSEETGDESSTRSAKGAVFKSGKGRVVKARPTTAHTPVAADVKSPNGPPQQVMVYQTMPVPWQQQAMMDSYGMGRTYQGADGRSYAVQPSSTSLPAFASPSACDSIGSPSGASASDLSIFLSESRTHNTEVRMAVSKVGDKVDQVLGKVEAVLQSRSSSTVALMDNMTLMSTIQKMITENEQLKLELEDKRNKVEVQNDKIYQLLNSKQQYMEQSSASSGQEAAVAGMQAENAKLTAELAALRERANGMLLRQEKNQTSWEKQIYELKDIIKRLQKDLDGKNNSRVDIKEKLEEIKELKESLAALTSLKEDAESKLASAKEEIVASKNEALHQMANLTEKYSSQISVMESQGNLMKKQLETLKARTSSSPESQTADKVRAVMNAVWKALQVQFQSEPSYEAEAIRKTLISTIRDVTNQHVNLNVGSSAKDVKVTASPAREVKATAAPLAQDSNVAPPSRTPSPPLKEASPPKTVVGLAAKTKTPSPPPKNVKASPPAPRKINAAPVKVEASDKPAEGEKPKPTERKIPVSEPTSKSKSTAEKTTAAVNPVKKEEVVKKSIVNETQKVMSESKSTPAAQTSPRQTPKPSPKHTPKPSPKQSPVAPRKAVETIESKSEDVIARDNKPVSVVDSKQDTQAKKADTTTKTDEPEGWRPEPPPLFDTDDDDDAWFD